MARRTVTHVSVTNGRVRTLCNPQEWWSPRTGEDAIVGIEAGEHTYWAVQTDGTIARIQPSGDFALLVALDSVGADVLPRLPKCQPSTVPAHPQAGSIADGGNKNR